MFVTTHSAEPSPTNDAASFATALFSIPGVAGRCLSRMAATCFQVLLERRTRLMLDELDEHLQRDIGYAPRRRPGGSVRF